MLLLFRWKSKHLSKEPLKVYQYTLSKDLWLLKLNADRCHVRTKWEKPAANLDLDLHFQPSHHFDESVLV